jgi:hypothetical protein
MTAMLEAKIDTARFDSRRWYVDGYASHWFTTKEDAEAAIGLANQVSRNDREELAGAVRQALNGIL